MGDKDKAARLAAALRANLKRRKARARGESSVTPEPAADAQRRTSDPIE